MITNSLIYSQLIWLPTSFWSGNLVAPSFYLAVRHLEVGVKVATQNAHGSNKKNVWTQYNHPEILRYTHNKAEYLKGNNMFCFKAPLFSVLAWFNLVFNAQKFPGCMSGWIRLVRHWNQAVWGIPLLNHQKPKFFGCDLMKFTINRDVCFGWNHFPKLKTIEVSCGPVFSWSFRHSIDKIPKNPELAIPTSFIIWSSHFLFRKRKGPQKTNPMALLLLSVGFLNSQNMETTLTWKRSSKLVSKKRLRTFIATFPHLLLQPATFHHLQVGFKVLSTKKVRLLFFSQAPRYNRRDWVSPTTPQDQDSGLKLKMFACGGSTDVCLVGRFVVEPRLFL